MKGGLYVSMIPLMWGCFTKKKSIILAILVPYFVLQFINSLNECQIINMALVGVGGGKGYKTIKKTPILLFQVFRDFGISGNVNKS